MEAKEKSEEEKKNDDQSKSGSDKPKSPTDWSNGQVIVLDDDEPD